MDRDRFQGLAEAYGGDIGRWPASEQAAALSLVARQPTWSDEVLREALRLDQALDQWRVTEAGHVLRETVIARAPRLLRRARYATRILGSGAGLGLAGASAAGLAAGVFLGVQANHARLDTLDLASPDEAAVSDISESVA